MRKVVFLFGMTLYKKLRLALEKEDVVIHHKWRNIFNPVNQGEIHYSFCEISILAAPRRGVFSLDDAGLTTLNQKLEALCVPFQDIPYHSPFIPIASFEEMVRRAQEPKPNKFYLHNYELCKPHEQQPNSIDVGKIFLEETVGHVRHKWSHDYALSLSSPYRHEFKEKEFEGSARNGLDISELRRSVELYLFPSVEFLCAWDRINRRVKKKEKLLEKIVGMIHYLKN